jgi:hypothetical protein
MGALHPANRTVSAKEFFAHIQFDQVMLIPASGRRALEPDPGSFTGWTCRRAATGTCGAASAWPVGPTTPTLGIPPCSEQALADVLDKMTAPANDDEEPPTGVSRSVAERLAGVQAATCDAGAPEEGTDGPAIHATAATSMADPAIAGLRGLTPESPHSGVVSGPAPWSGNRRSSPGWPGRAGRAGAGNAAWP